MQNMHSLVVSVGIKTDIRKDEEEIFLVFCIGLKIELVM